MHWFDNSHSCKLSIDHMIFSGQLPLWVFSDVLFWYWILNPMKHNDGNNFLYWPPWENRCWTAARQCMSALLWVSVLRPRRSWHVNQKESWNWTHWSLEMTALWTEQLIAKNSWLSLWCFMSHSRQAFLSSVGESSNLLVVPTKKLPTVAMCDVLPIYGVPENNPGLMLLNFSG